MSKRIKSITTLSFVILIAISLGISYKVHTSKIETDREELFGRVDQLFKSKDVIADGNKMEISGAYSDRGFNLVSGGFKIYELSKESGGYIKTILEAGNIKYKQPEYTYTYGYKSSNWDSPRSCYDAAFEFLLFGNKDSKKDIYTENTLTEIKDFPDGFYSKFFYINNIEHPTESYILQNGTGQVYNSQREVDYYQQKRYYSVIEDDVPVKRSLAIHLAVGLVVAIILTIIIYIILKQLSPTVGKGETILNTKWKNIDSGSIMTIEQKSFGKYSVTILEDEKLKKGDAKFTENGNHLHLSFSETEIYYNILSIGKDKLELENLTSNKIVKFEKLGSNAYKQADNTEKIITENNNIENNS
jgi:hypothetical protein